MLTQPVCGVFGLFLRVVLAVLTGLGDGGARTDVFSAPPNKTTHSEAKLGCIDEFMSLTRS